MPEYSFILVDRTGGLGAIQNITSNIWNVVNAWLACRKDPNRWSLQGLCIDGRPTEIKVKALGRDIDRSGYTYMSLTIGRDALPVKIPNEAMGGDEEPLPDYGTNDWETDALLALMEGERGNARALVEAVGSGDDRGKVERLKAAALSLADLCADYLRNH